MNDLTKINWKSLTPEQKGAFIKPLITIDLLTYAQIAKIAGTTRSAIAAAADRHDITSPLTSGHTGATGSKGGTAFKARQPKNPKVKQPRPERPKFSRIAPTQPIALPDDLVDRTPLKPGAWTPLPNSTPKPLHDLEPGQCRWPVGVDSPFLFCGDTALRGKVYCHAHHAIAFKPRPDDGRKKGTAA